MSTYVNTSMYQPNLYSNYNSYGNGLSTGFSLSNYNSPSVFQGQSMNTGCYSPMAPQQQNANDSFMQQLVLLLLSFLLQGRSQPKTTEITEETIIED
ncbi:MAG: hypothetical protein A2039_01940 [Candidatus Melainabacteria bacterium GWA2_34_9]|nr:MAG: hypothetical protein A2039_01940 [Candidatus Melainabacteria bacterium GWA2_34_9]